MNIAVTLN